MTHEAVAQAAEFTAPPAGIGFFEKWLSVWVALCIVAGLALGNLLPGAFETLAAWEYASVNLVRSEEHTSELQSLMRISYAVFCLQKKKQLPEKKKKI